MAGGTEPEPPPEPHLILIGADLHIAIYLELGFSDASALRQTCTALRDVPDSAGFRVGWMARHGASYHVAREAELKRLALHRMRSAYVALDEEALEVDCDPTPRAARWEEQPAKSPVVEPPRPLISKRQAREIAQAAARMAALRRQQAFFADLDCVPLEHDVSQEA